MKTLLYTILQDKTVLVSIYNVKGKRYKIEHCSYSFQGMTAFETDKAYGFIGYALNRPSEFVVREYKEEHPKHL